MKRTGTTYPFRGRLERTPGNGKGIMGRKKVKPKTPADERIDIRLRVDGEFYRQIRAIAEAEKTTVAGYLRSLAVKDMKQRRREA
jgi:hypothetical protein